VCTGWNDVDDPAFSTVSDAFEKNYFSVEYVQQSAIAGGGAW
jgi:hypothetical protein